MAKAISYGRSYRIPDISGSGKSVIDNDLERAAWRGISKTNSCVVVSEVRLAYRITDDVLNLIWDAINDELYYGELHGTD